MKLRRLLAAGAAGAGATALCNRLLRARAGDAGSALAGDHHTRRWRGMDVACTEAGDPDDPTLVLLHGVNAAASAEEFRTVWDGLAGDYHLVAPDLPGFGRSDRPPLRYSAGLYEEFVAEFLDGFDPAGVVASSLTAAYAAADAGAVDHLVLVCPTTTTFDRRRPWLRELLRAPLVGTALYHLATSKPSIRHANRDHGYYDPANVTAELVDRQWRLAHQPGARFAPAAFFAGELDSDLDLGERLAAHDAEVTLVWGREAELTPLWAGRDLAEAAGARLVVFDHALLQPHVEHPAAFVDLVRDTV